ncbi:hypothetical protein ETAA8_05440 [Anatilimnocola aggregata]|uniref:IRE (Iron responsive element)-like protein n=1 Tax=Anatilimnocola aggregata TaxID=2528021 RepID=A0A517Y5K1_9BACT|nr:hypothetical protein [Anatilimnocola aggregata]QDU25476.1 hypothetical protein ETAA8_05440 [Anatilimnocola aggregata]
MNKNQSLTRKVVYITAIALLMIPLSRLSEPATLTRTKDESGQVREVGTPGGTLARMRAEHGLAQAQLGEIDPASATMKLATLGMRPVAVSVLWQYANHYKKVKDWDKLEATVEQIIRLQPNDLEVWDFQAHNLSYNVSVEFDDYRYRYQWVKNGIAFLIQGTEYNRDEPGLLNQVGWFTGQKIGRSDEAKQFRRLFRDDKEFHKLFLDAGVDVDQYAAKGYDGKPDNWLVAKLWYDRAMDAALNSGRPIRGKTPLLFYSGAPMSLINGAAAIEKDGHFGDRAKVAWESASEMWYGGDDKSGPKEVKQVYGNRLIPTSAGFDIRLNDLEEVEQRMKTAAAELDKLAPGVREKLSAEKKAALPEDVRALLDKPIETLTSEQYQKLGSAPQQIIPRNEEVASQVTGPGRVRALQLADQLEAEAKLAQYIKIYRGIVNFEYWRDRCRAESKPRMLAARAKVFEADRKLELGQGFSDVQKLYEDSFQAFAEIYADFPDLMANPEAEELVESVERYRDLLSQLDKPFPADFVLNEMLDKHQRGRKIRDLAKLVSDAATDSNLPKKSDDKKEEESKKEEPKKEESKPADEKKPEEKKPEEKPAADEKPKDDAQKVENKPAEKQADEKPVEKKAEEKKAEEKKAEEQPAEKK